MKHSTARAAASAGGATRFVSVGTVKLRATPGRTGHVLANLPVNTPLTVLQADAVPCGWLAVRLSSEPPLFGYVGAAFLSRKPQSAEAVAKQQAAPRGIRNPEAIKISLERLAARAPSKAQLLEGIKRLHGPLAAAVAAKRLDTHGESQQDSGPGVGEAHGDAFSGQGARSWHVYNRLSGARHVISLRWRDSQLRFSVEKQGRDTGTTHVASQGFRDSARTLRPKRRS